MPEKHGNNFSRRRGLAKLHGRHFARLGGPFRLDTNGRRIRYIDSLFLEFGQSYGHLRMHIPCHFASRRYVHWWTDVRSCRYSRSRRGRCSHRHALPRRVGRVVVDARGRCAVPETSVRTPDALVHSLKSHISLDKRTIYQLVDSTHDSYCRRYIQQQPRSLDVSLP